MKRDARKPIVFGCTLKAPRNQWVRRAENWQPYRELKTIFQISVNSQEMLQLCRWTSEVLAEGVVSGNPAGVEDGVPQFGGAVGV
jgi:hypothetical protein